MFRQALFLAADMQIKMDAFKGLGLDPVNGRWCKPSPGYLKLKADESFRDGKVMHGVYYVLRNEDMYGVLRSVLISSLILRQSC